MITVVTSVPTPAGRTIVHLSPFTTRLQAALGASGDTLTLMGSVSAELFAVLSTTFYTPLVLMGAGGNEAVNAYFDGGVLKITRVTNTMAYPVGTCVSSALTGLAGAPGAQGAQGAPGGFGDIGPQGPQGVAGAVGDAGADGDDGLPGSFWFFGVGLPNPLMGTTKDYYLGMPEGDVFSKASGVWQIVGSLKGPGGADGTNSSEWYNGVGVPAPGVGADNDFYINTSNGDLYKKAGGSWGVVANIRGPQGVFGNNGTPGSRWFFGTDAPDDSFGSSIDFYLDADTGDWYEKSSGTWQLGGSLKGVPGDTGYSESMHLHMTRTTPITTGNNTFVSPQNTVVLYNDIAGSSMGAPGTVNLGTGAYVVFGSGEISLSFSTAYPTSYVCPSCTLTAEVFDGTTWNIVETYSTYGAQLMFGTNNWFVTPVAPHGVIDVPNASGGFRIRASGDWNTIGAGLGTAAISMTIKLTVLRVQ